MGTGKSGCGTLPAGHHTVGRSGVVFHPINSFHRSQLIRYSLREGSGVYKVFYKCRGVFCRVSKTDNMCRILIFPSYCLDWEPTSLVHDILLFEEVEFIERDQVQLIAARLLVSNIGPVCLLAKLRDLALRQTQMTPTYAQTRRIELFEVPMAPYLRYYVHE